MSYKPVWFGGLILVIAGVIWWGLNVQEQVKARRTQEALEEKIKTYKVFIVEQEQLIKTMNDKLKTMDEKALSDQFSRLQSELKELTLKSPNDMEGRKVVMQQMNKVQMDLDSAREQRETIKARIESFKESITNSKTVLAESEKKLKELRGGK